MNDAITSETRLTVGLDVGDRYVQVCVLDEAGEIVEESRIPTKAAALERRFSGGERLRIVLEAGLHSPWLSRLLESLRLARPLRLSGVRCDWRTQAFYPNLSGLREDAE